LVIEIYASDIPADHKSSTTDCPVARAIKRALPDAEVCVGVFRAYVNHRCIELPSHVQRWIIDMCYDRPLQDMGATLYLSE
jgi:hypothetical protein